MLVTTSRFKRAMCISCRPHVDVRKPRKGEKGPAHVDRVEGVKNLIFVDAVNGWPLEQKVVSCRSESNCQRVRIGRFKTADKLGYRHSRALRLRIVLINVRSIIAKDHPTHLICSTLLVVASGVDGSERSGGTFRYVLLSRSARSGTYYFPGELRYFRIYLWGLHHSWSDWETQRR